MQYLTNLFSPETYKAFSESERKISGFRTTQRGMAAKVRPGDRLMCYVTRLSRWVGILEVVSGPFDDATPLFLPTDDPFILRFNVKPIVWLPLEQAVPIHDSCLWNELSFTRGQPLTSSKWTGQVRNSLRVMDAGDGKLIEKLLLKQAQQPKAYLLTEEDQKSLDRTVVRRAEGEVRVTIPSSESFDSNAAPDTKLNVSEVRESIQIQALLAKIGATMGMKVWVPASDRARVLEEWPEGRAAVLDTLPLNYNDTTIATIERIDVLWLKGRAIQRAFEVEHTTSVYSGILRMADLLALQPNMDIRLHLVAPDTRRHKVFDEIRRPVFSLLERRPLAEICTFLSYDAVREIGELKHLSHLSDAVLDEYAEEAE